MIVFAFHLLHGLVSKRKTVGETYQETNTNGEIRCGTTHGTTNATCGCPRGWRMTRLAGFSTEKNQPASRLLGARPS